MPDTPPWISVGELGEAFGLESNALPMTADLVGKTLDLHFENGAIVEHQFKTSTVLVWNVVSGADEGQGAEETYWATKVREGVYFVDFIKHLEPATSATLLVDLDHGIVTALIGQLPSESEARQPLSDRITQRKELTGVTATFFSGAINVPFLASTPRHSVTQDLVNKRVEYTYSPTERYEHIYLNENFYTWHCLAGSEKGLADTERCHYYKLAENLYLFVWREKIVPTLGVVVVDFDRMKTTGKILGYQGNDFGKLSNFAVGAHARLLNVTCRDGKERTR